jgi:hypothetical protein
MFPEIDIPPDTLELSRTLLHPPVVLALDFGYLVSLV